jgi:long-chain fatty acid transport protein
MSESGFGLVGRGGLKGAVLGLIGALAAGGQACATDGYFSHGYGAQSKGIAGAGLAYPKDALAIATNPAAAFALGDRTDVDIDYFQADRHASLIGNAYGPNRSYSGNGGGPSPIPEFGLTRRVGDKWALGLAVYGNGGMQTDYKTNPFARFGASGPAGVSLVQVFISPTAAYEIAPGHSIGVALDVGGQQFKAHGIQPFAFYSADPAHFTDKASTITWGYGAKIGYLGQITPKFSVGAFYQSRTFMGKFGKYAGLFADGGAFDIPSSYGVGVAYKATDKLDLVLDVHRIDYSEIASVGRPLSPLFTGHAFGTKDGPGFGWRDVTAVKLGANYRINPAWQVRAGWGYATNPVPRSQTLLNILAPGVVENQFTAGATWTRPSGFEVSAYVLEAPRNTVKGSGSIPGGPGGFGGGEANISLGETAFGIGFGWKH